MLKILAKHDFSEERPSLLDHGDMEVVHPYFYGIFPILGRALHWSCVQPLFLRGAVRLATRPGRSHIRGGMFLEQFLKLPRGDAGTRSAV
jgi:hypothetical protein